MAYYSGMDLLRDELTVNEVAERLQAHPLTIRRWLRSGKIQGVKPGGAKLGWRIPRREVERLLNK